MQDFWHYGYIIGTRLFTILIASEAVMPAEVSLVSYGYIIVDNKFSRLQVGIIYVSKSYAAWIVDFYLIFLLNGVKNFNLFHRNISCCNTTHTNIVLTQMKRETNHRNEKVYTVRHQHIMMKRCF